MGNGNGTANTTSTRPFQRKHAAIIAIDHGENPEPGKRCNDEKGSRKRRLRHHQGPVSASGASSPFQGLLTGSGFPFLESAALGIPRVPRQLIPSVGTSDGVAASD